LFGISILAGFKVCLLVWLLPGLGNGSELICDEFVDPVLTRNKATIHEAINIVSDVTSCFLSELVKIIYHFLVDVVEQCWQLTRNGNDIYVTPRLQVLL